MVEPFPASMSRAAAALLLTLFVGQALTASLDKTPTYDEPTHIGAGLSYWKTGEFKVNPQHPPLLKEAATLPLLADGVRWPVTPEAWAALGPRVDPLFQWHLGNAVLFANDPERVLFWSRLPMLLLATLLGWTIWAWGRQMLGGLAGVAALLLFALDPALVAHGALVTTDVGCATFATLFLFALWRFERERTPARLVLGGLALGGALAAKFSSVFLVPIAAGLLLLGAPGAGRRRLTWTAGVLVAMLGVAAVVVEAVYFFPRDPSLYWDGLRQVNADHYASYQAYMAGEFRPRFWSYYVVAYLLKEPIPSIVLAVVGLGAIARPGAVRPIDRAFLLLPPVVLVAAYTLFSHNIGLRYIIPALPFLHLLGGAGLAALLTSGRVRRAAGIGLAAWLAVAAVGIYPDHLSYFNEAACLLTEPRQLGLDGGTRCGVRWLDESNVDWGQGVGQLAAWLAAHPGPSPVHLAYFGRVPPDRYGVRYVPLDRQLLERSPPPGRYVLSAHNFARFRAAQAAQGEGWLLGARPTAIVGHAYYVFDVPER
jgi:dolichyl-phosphate-mannose-protein mannosyltransferase